MSTAPIEEGGGSAPSIAVGIATLDRPAGLARCLEAVLDGDVPPSQVVVVDQGRSDESAQVIRDVAAGRTVPVSLVRQDQRGLSASRNAAVARASSRIVAVTDDDCVPDRGWLAAVRRAFAASDPPAAVTGRLLPLGPPTPGTYAIATRASEVPAEYAGRHVPWVVGTGGNFAVDLDWLSRVGGYDERLGTGSPGRAGEDLDLIYRLLKAGARIRYEPAAVVYHERHSAARRVATRESYGYGVGAMCGMSLRGGDPFAVALISRFMLMHARGIGGAVRTSRAFDARGHLLSLRGLVGGIAYGLRRGGGRPTRGAPAHAGRRIHE